MRSLGEIPLTSAQKQKRHRERVKARLDEAEALKARYLGKSGEIVGLTDYYSSLLRDLGASLQETEILTGTIASLHDELAGLLRERGQAALELLRKRKKRSGAGLLARLADVDSPKNR